MQTAAIFKEIVLVGGGHAHALVIKQWGMNPVPGVRLSLISPQVQTPYSGMLPGLIAGHYDFDQIHIDLAKICHWAGVRFIQDKVTALDLESKTLLLENRPTLHYDLLSLDIGSTPDHSINGVSEYASPIKPISGFYQHWQATLAHLQESTKEQKIAVVGGGAGSVEVILAMAWAVRNDPLIKANKIHFTLLSRSSSILSAYPASVIKAAKQACHALGITLESSFDVGSVTATQVISRQDQAQDFDHLFWCTQASAQDWVSATGLACNEGGFIRVNKYLQSISHPSVFAAGDIAHLESNPRPKAGVYAVREAPILFENLCHLLLKQKMTPYLPQDNFLSLLSLGGKKALAVRAPLPSFSGAWVWRWKDKIDKKFMNIFQHLPEKIMSSTENGIDSTLIPNSEKSEKLSPAERCGGCGAKIGSAVLEQVLKDVLGAYQPEDASIIQWPSNSLIQTIDHIKASFDEPYLFGRIAVFHALSDLFAMNAQAHSIHLAVTLPFAGREIQTRELRQVLQGVQSACTELKVELLGGHSAEGSELSIAISANGLAKQKLFKKQGLAVGDLLVLSKPLGNGIVLAGQMQGLSQGKDLEVALRWMNQSNQAMAGVLEELGVQCSTDVTGFGLLGHLTEMLDDDPTLKVMLFPEKMPYLPGALALAERGVRSSLFPQNALKLTGDGRWHALQDSIFWPLLLDPQTSGGLLAGVPAQHEQAAIAAGLTVIGKVAAN